MSWFQSQKHYLYYAIISIFLTTFIGLAAPLSSILAHRTFGFDGDNAVGIGAVYIGIVLLLQLSGLWQTSAHLEHRGKAVLVTGCDTGFGLKLAQLLDEKGMHVFAGCYNLQTDGAKLLRTNGSERLKVIKLDVTNQKEVDDAIEIIQNNLPAGAKGLWGIVNNAGASAFGDVEFSSIELYKSVAEVNLFGVIRITKACLPLIRRARGRVVFMASGLSRMTAPSRSVYCVTKYGIQAFSTVLRYEMERWGVKVSLIEPGNYISGTKIFTKESVVALGKKLWQKAPEQVQDDYGKKDFERQVEMMLGYCNTGMHDTTPVTDAYTNALLEKYPRETYNPMDMYWLTRLFIMVHLPSWIGNYLYIPKAKAANKFN